MIFYELYFPSSEPQPVVYEEFDPELAGSACKASGLFIVEDRAQGEGGSGAVQELICVSRSSTNARTNKCDGPL